MKEVRILLVGLGGMGNVHYLNYQKIEGVKVVAAVGSCESDKKRADEWQLPFYTSLDAALDECAVNLVDITTPTFLHYDMVKKCLERGFNTLCEKPLCLSKEEAVELFAIANKQKVHLYVALVLEFIKETAVLREALKSGIYGNVVDAVFTRLSAAPLWSEGNWLFDRSKSGLLPFDLHIHDLDLIVSLFGVPDKYSAMARGLTSKGYSQLIHMEYGYKDFTVHAEAGWLNGRLPFTAVWRVVFEHAVIVNDGSTVTIYKENGEVEQPDISYPVVISTGINVPPTGWYFEELKCITEAVRENREVAFITEKQVIEVIGIASSLPY